VPLLVFACAERDEVASIGLIMRAPLGALDGATQVKLSVFAADLAKCEASTGHVDAIPAEGTQSFNLEKGGCPKGLSWCKTITLDKDGSTQMFAVQATGPAGLLAEGCTTAKINQDPLDVTIQLQRYTPPACCNDGKLQAGEQCDSGVAAAEACNGAAAGVCGGVIPDQVCECDCRAKEIALDRAFDQAATIPPVGTKTALTLLFAPGDTPDLQDGLRGAFNDTSAQSTQGDVALRVLKKDLFAIDLPIPFASPQIIPKVCGGLGGTTRRQQNPALTLTGTDALAIVYESSEKSAGRFDITVFEQDASGCAGAGAAPQRVSTTDLVNSLYPAAARGPNGNVLIVWLADGGDLLARVYKPGGAMDEPEFKIASGAGRAKIAGNANGWIVVYGGSGAGDTDGVYMRTISPSSTVGPEQLVNTITAGVQDQPDVAMFDDGRMLVTWRSGGDVYFQRFDGAKTAVAGDQDAPLNTMRDGEQLTPVVAASRDVGDFFAVAWQSNGNISARFVGADSGFLYNSVTGQNDEFSAAHPSIASQRQGPAIAIGRGGFVAIGWEDQSVEHAGVYVRRFPLPTAE
jgi:hypothetical protein